MPDDDDNDISNIPFHDDDDELPAAATSRDSGLKLDLDDSLNQVNNLNRDDSIGGLAVSPDQTTKRPRKTGPKRMRKRRKVIIDNDNTQLSGEHIKAMLDDTSDICLQTRIHPADWTKGGGEDDDDDDDDDDDTRRSNITKLNLCNRLSYDKLILRPQLADDAALAPAALQLWWNNTAEARGHKKTFRLRGKAGEEQQAQRRMEQDALAQEEEEVEIGRQGRGDSEQGDGQQSSIGDVEFPTQDQDNEFPTPDQGDEDTPIPFDDEFEAPPFQEEDAAMANEGVKSPGSAFELGLVNDFEEDLDHDPRQAAGTDLVSSDSKWHNHTVKVLSMLKNQMSNGEEEDDEDGAAPKGTELSYDKLSTGCSRHTAASVFFELLQLKTWDFIELGQQESYGDIQITPGLRFNETHA